MLYINPVDGLNTIVPVDNVARLCVLTIADLTDLTENTFEIELYSGIGLNRYFDIFRAT